MKPELPVLKMYMLPNGRRYRILDTGEPYRKGYPEINEPDWKDENDMNLTANTGYMIQVYDPKNYPSTPWMYISTGETLEDAIMTIGMFGRTRNRKDIDSWELISSRQAMKEQIVVAIILFVVIEVFAILNYHYLHWID